MEDCNGKFKKKKTNKTAGWKNNLYSIVETLARLLNKSKIALVKARKDDK